MRAALPFLLVAISFPAQAQEPIAAGRFSLVPVENGALRLDTQTGEVSLCAEAAGGLACRAVPVERSQPADDPAEYSDRIAALEARIAALEAEAATRGPALSDTEAMDRVADLAEQAMRRFFGVVRDLRRELEEENL